MGKDDVDMTCQLPVEHATQPSMKEISGIDIESQIGPWPRWLLHVESMRSYAWNPGNVYRDIKEPRYNAISYTWGRWKLNHGERPDVAGLQVHGTPWSIPRVHPEHFSAEELHQVIRRTTAAWEEDDSDRVEFMWIDIACIDQRFSRESMLEIGRQAEIFRGAQYVYIWLNCTSTDELSRLAGSVVYLETYAFGDLPSLYQDTDEAWEAMKDTPGSAPMSREEVCAYMEEEAENRSFPMTWIADGLRDLGELCQKGWFTSLWTLQEAFLRRDALFLSKEGLCIYPSRWESKVSWMVNNMVEEEDVFSLDGLLNACDTLRLSLERNLLVDDAFTQAEKEAARQTLGLLDKSGFNALNCGNPMELYTAATNRRPSNILDSVYGIMQVFEFRLGQSSPSADPSSTFTLQQLEDELGLALMRLSPVLSQCFRHVEYPRAFGKNWRVGQLSTVPPRVFQDSMPWEPETYQGQCSLGNRLVNDVLWGWFDGKVCPFSTLQSAWAYEEGPWTEHMDKIEPKWGEDRGAVRLVLDFAPDLFPHWNTPEDYDIRRSSDHLRVARALTTAFEAADLRVLHLGFFEPSPDSQTHFGLILLRQADVSGIYWRRLGICHWDAWSERPKPLTRKFEGQTVVRTYRPGDIPNFDAWAAMYKERLPTQWEDLVIQSDAWVPASGRFG